MELVEGETLADRIARGPIPVDEVLPIARQIAEALEAAHEQGIIHRDLKPANIRLRPDGTVKVLDFGLAKALEAAPVASGGLSMSPTISSPAMTGVGVLLGTAAYMAPEQARGKAADKRADIWAFGCVLYEMLTGRRAFAGDDVSDALASVLAREPDWTLLPRGLSPVLVTYLKRCLHKDRKQRIGEVQTVRLALEGAFETGEPGRSPSRAARLLAMGCRGDARTPAAARSSGGRGPHRRQHRLRCASMSASGRVSSSSSTRTLTARSRCSRRTARRSSTQPRAIPCGGSTCGRSTRSNRGHSPARRTCATPSSRRTAAGLRSFPAACSRRWR